VLRIPWILGFVGRRKQAEVIFIVSANTEDTEAEDRKLTTWEP
jgi:hypothetical protein